MKILLCASEVAPFAKTGGLADVAGALPLALAALGHDVRVVLPRYRAIKPEGWRPVTEFTVHVAGQALPVRILQTTFPKTQIPVYGVDQPACFDRDGLYNVQGKDFPDNLTRFTLFARAALELLPRLSWQPDVIHCNDWQTGLIPVYLRTGGVRIPTVFTIHNLQHKGLFPKDQWGITGLDGREFSMYGLEFYDQISLIKGGLAYSEALTTVSQTYAKEVQTTEYGEGLDGLLRTRAQDLVGILNGIDQDEWNPATDPALPARFTAKDLKGKAQCKAALQKEQGLAVSADVPLVGMITRLADQKGIDLVAEAWKSLMATKAQFVILGSGEPKYHALLEDAAKKHPTQVALNLKFDVALSHRIEAAADLFLMPSRFEPCGLNQMYSLRYGTIPVVRRTGGLADTVVDATPVALADHTANGFVFEEYTAKELLATFKRAIKSFKERELWKQLMQTGMRQDFSWRRSAGEYVRTYERVIAAAKSAGGSGAAAACARPNTPNAAGAHAVACG